MGPSTIAIKATSDDTGGKFFLWESTVAAGFPGPPPHVHDEFHDMFYVLESELNRTAAPVRMLNFNAPGGWENYMRDVAAASAGGTPPTSQEIGKIAARHDFRPV